MQTDFVFLGNRITNNASTWFHIDKCSRFCVAIEIKPSILKP